MPDQPDDGRQPGAPPHRGPLKARDRSGYQREKPPECPDAGDEADAPEKVVMERPGLAEQRPAHAMGRPGQRQQLEWHNRQHRPPSCHADDDRAGDRGRRHALHHREVALGKSRRVAAPERATPPPVQRSRDEGDREGDPERKAVQKIERACHGSSFVYRLKEQESGIRQVRNQESGIRTG